MKTKSKKNNSTLIQILFGILLALSMIVFNNNIISSANSSNLTINLLVTFVFFFFSYLIQIIIHEFGHLIFGLIVGYKFSSFRIGNILFYKDKNKIKIKRFSVPGTAGQCLLYPPKNKTGANQAIIYLLGGSIINIVISVVLIILYIQYKDTKYLSEILFFTGSMGIFVGLLNLIPMRLNLVNNDGYSAVMIKKNPKALKAFWIQLNINMLHSNGEFLRNMPDEWFYIPDDDELKNSLTSTIGLFTYNRMIEKFEFKEAYELLLKLNSDECDIPGLHKTLLTADKIYLELIFGELNLANDSFNNEFRKQMKIISRSISCIRMEYAYALLYEKNNLKANLLKIKFDKYAKLYPFENDVITERLLVGVVDDLVRRKEENNYGV